ncbi:MAG: LytTR family DNA-binding domain-containing protein [Bacteroidota bacterium]
MFTTIIIDDENPAPIRLKRLLTTFADKITIIGEADCGIEAIHQVEELRPDVLFLDVQMPDMTGFEVLAKLTYQPLVIFTTAYEQYAIKAFENYSVDYLVKPFGAARFERAVQKLEKFGSKKTAQAPTDFKKLEQLFKSLKPIKKSFTFPVKVGDKILLIDYKNIHYFQAEDKYVRVFVKDGKSYLGDWSLGKLVVELPEDFVRVHRSYIINKSSIGTIQKYFKGKFVLTLNDTKKTAITTGSTYSDEVKQLLALG